MAHSPEYIDPLGKTDSKSLESIEFDPDLGGHVVILEKDVPHRSVRPVSAFEQTNVLNSLTTNYPGTLLQESVRNERNTTQSRLSRRYYPKKNGVSVFPTKVSRQVDRTALAEFVDQLRITQEIVVRGQALPAIDPLTISVDQTLYSPDLDRRVTTAGTIFAVRNDVETDPDTGLMTQVDRSVVYVLPSLAEQAVGQNLRFREIATGVWIKEQRTALKSDGTPVDPASAVAFYTRTWDTWENYTMPGYMYLIEPSGDYQTFKTVFLPSQRRTVVLFKPPVRLPFDVLTKVTYTETLHAAQPVKPSNLRNFAGKDWRHDGTLVNIDIRGILMDTTTTDLATNAADSYHGAITERVVSQETTPISAFEYRNSLLGSTQVVEAHVTPGPNKTFRMLTKQVKMQGNVTANAADVGVNL